MTACRARDRDFHSYVDLKSFKLTRACGANPGLHELTNGSDLGAGQDILKYVDSAGDLPWIFAFMSPPLQGIQSIGDAGDAGVFAQAVRERLGQLLKAHWLRTTRLFY